MMYVWILLSLFTFSVQAMEKPVAFIFPFHEVLLMPDALSLLPPWLSPKEVENIIIEATRNNKDSQGNDYCDPSVESHSSKSLSPVFIGWVSDNLLGEKMKEYAITGKSYAIKKKPLFERPVLHLVLPTAINIAASPDQAASHLKAVPEVIALLHVFKELGIATFLASNSNSKSFEALEKKHPTIFSLFNKCYTSGKPGQPGSSIKLQALTNEKTFWEAFLQKNGSQYRYAYLANPDDTETNQAAEQTGISVLPVTGQTGKEKVAAIMAHLSAVLDPDLKARIAAKNGTC